MAKDAEVTVGGRICDIESITVKQIICRAPSFYQEHQVYLTGASWFPKKLDVAQNDIITWKWVTAESVNVEIASVDSPDEINSNGDFSLNQISGNVGTISRYMSESPGVYYYTSGYLDASYSQYANGEIKVSTAKDYEVEVKLKLVGFEAQVEANQKNQNIQKNACDPVESDYPNKDDSELVTFECESDCLKHTYSFKRTGVASSVHFDGNHIEISGDDLFDGACAEQFEVIGWSEYGEVNFVVESVEVLENMSQRIY